MYAHWIKSVKIMCYIFWKVYVGVPLMVRRLKMPFGIRCDASVRVHCACKKIHIRQWQGCLAAGQYFDSGKNVLSIYSQDITERDVNHNAKP